MTEQHEIGAGGPRGAGSPPHVDPVGAGTHPLGKSAELGAEQPGRATSDFEATDGTPRRHE